ncbi:hypothetical protein GLOIN_2v1124436 [Rhizophagus irregularis DAOM 181602=DAOM 197198]|nr:hypothetical protein GLOIN_2v1124436 [Rhizophagus irregularis DAOM 181602=DAOM 197198]
MSITYFVKSNTTVNASKLVGTSLEGLKVMECDNQDDFLRNLTLNDGDELLATRELEEYWLEKLPKRHRKVAT